jgi:hypothetical protein
MNSSALAFGLSGLNLNPEELSGLGATLTPDQMAQLKYFFVGHWFKSRSLTRVYSKIGDDKKGINAIRFIDSGTAFKVLEISSSAEYGYISGGGWIRLNLDMYKIDPNAPESTGESIANAFTRIGQRALNFLENVAGAVENVSKTAERSTGALSWIVPVALIGAVSLGGYYLWKHYGQGNQRIKVKGVTV